MLGIVRWYSSQGFGFIDPPPIVDGASALYFHIADVKGRVILNSGDEVTFDTVRASKGPKCIRVTKVTETKEDSQPCLSQVATRA